MGNQYTLKVYPAGRGNSVYRIIEIAGKEKLETLCDVILSAFDFDEGHMYEFCMDNRMYSENSYQSHPEYGQASVKAKLDKLNLAKGQKFTLHYDFGDDWMFTINVQKITEVSRCHKPTIMKEKGQIEQY